MPQNMGNESKTAKGASKPVVNKTIIFNDYEDVFDTSVSLTREDTSIRSFNQQLFTYRPNRIANTSLYDTMKVIYSMNGEPCGYVKYIKEENKQK
jgi:hypothetical protein